MIPSIVFNKIQLRRRLADRLSSNNANNNSFD